MAKSDRNGKLKKRSVGGRRPDLGYYIIVTNTKRTERYYFEGFHKSIPEEYQDRIAIKVVTTETGNLLDECRKQMAYDPQYRKLWVVIDCDQEKDFNHIIEEAHQREFDVGWSNPCIEIWLYAYFGKMPKIKESWKCVSSFEKIFQQKTGVEYSKTDSTVYQRLYQIGDEEKAIRIAELKYQQCIREDKRTPSEMYPATTVHLLVKEIRGNTGGMLLEE